MRKLIAGAALALIGSAAGGTAFAGEVGGSKNGNGPKATPPGSTPTALRVQRPR